MNKYAFVIPVYRHGSTLESVICALEGFGCPVIVVDDGNPPADKQLIQQAIGKHPCAVLISLSKNSGKGRAVTQGMIAARQLGVTHALQVDSDGQQDLSKVRLFLEQSEANPTAVICATPEYDESAPRSRVNGRKVALFWIRVVTLSVAMQDPLIGFRVYPVEKYCHIARHSVIDSRMAFDLDILAHFSWTGAKILFFPVRIFYPKDGISNFRAVRDNVRISFAYARLCVGMFLRFPVLLRRKIKRKGNGTLV